MNVLELFCGTGSVGKVCEELGHNVISVDLESKFKPTHICNILEFDYKQYPKDHFDIVWGSPPCTEYSVLKYSHLGRTIKGSIYTKERLEKDMEEADKLVLRTLEIINYFNPHYYFIENPFGRLKDRDIMKDKPYYVVDYCRYSDWGYKKRTCIWTNKKDFKPLRCNKECGNMIDGHHKNNLGNDFHKTKSFTLHEKYRIPPDLIYSLLE